MPGDPLLVEIRIVLLVVCHHRVVSRVLLCVAFLQFGKVRANVRGNCKRLFVPAVVFAHRLDRFFTQRFAVRTCGICLWRAVRNFGVYDDQ
ncbi:hypothetical protein SDC9_186691 [bioreactor metagenome]|uniref:Uncharacterized protein n=1 Tax=bioreactor metagenome TaxID=1076179 RepID=A0A645HUW5_9ZZZZ